MSQRFAPYVHLLVALTALAAAYFTVYALYYLVTFFSVKAGFIPSVATSIDANGLLLHIFLFFLIVSVFPFFLFVAWISFYTPKRPPLTSLPMVSIIIPAFNEQETVEKSIACALAQDYPNYEILVVDDGSSDFTPYLIEHPEIRAIHLPRNQGKARAVNEAIQQAKGEFILFSDSDSHLHHEAIKYLISNFNDPEVGAVSGQLMVRRNDRLIVLWQTIEYIFSQTIVKVAQCGSGSSVSVCPGPICMYRRSLLLSLGGFKHRTLVEDFDMTLEVIESGHKTVYDPRAVAWTSTPKTFKALKSQRIRWYRGNLQALKIHKNLLFNKKYGALGLFWFPYLLFWGFGGAILQVVLMFMFVVMLFFSDTPFQFGMFGVLLYFVFECLAIVQYIFTLTLDRNLKLKLVLASLIMKPYHIFLACMHIIAITRELRKAQITWR